MSTSTATGNKDVEKFDVDQLETFLRGKDLKLNDADFRILRGQDVDGFVFFELTYEQLVNHPFGFSGGKATKLAKVIKELNSQKQPVAAGNKRKGENSLITTDGPLQPRQGSLMLRMLHRDIFKNVKSGFFGGTSYIVYGPYQSGKSTLLLELRLELMGVHANYVHFSMPSIQGAILTNKRKGFYSYMSYLLFEESLSELETFTRIFKLESPLYLLIDEFQYIFTDSELCDVAKHFFREISSANICYFAVGTFILVDLNKENIDKEFISPFNKATFIHMQLFDTNEMSNLFNQYKLGLNEDGVPSDLTAEIIRESCGHPASFMILLKLFHDFQPTTNLWGKRLQENLAKYMNGTHIKLKYEINRMNSDEKRYLRSLTANMTNCWNMDLSNLTAFNDLDKKLFNSGILNIMGTDLVGFTSCIILRVCIDALFPTPSRLTLEDDVLNDVLKDPVELLALE